MDPFLIEGRNPDGTLKINGKEDFTCTWCTFGASKPISVFLCFCFSCISGLGE